MPPRRNKPLHDAKDLYDRVDDEGHLNKEGYYEAAKFSKLGLRLLEAGRCLGCDKAVGAGNFYILPNTLEAACNKCFNTMYKEWGYCKACLNPQLHVKHTCPDKGRDAQRVAPNKKPKQQPPSKRAKKVKESQDDENDEKASQDQRVAKQGSNKRRTKADATVSNRDAKRAKASQHDLKAQLTKHQAQLTKHQEQIQKEEEEQIDKSAATQAEFPICDLRLPPVDEEEKEDNYQEQQRRSTSVGGANGLVNFVYSAQRLIRPVARPTQPTHEEEEEEEPETQPATQPEQPETQHEVDATKIMAAVGVTINDIDDRNDHRVTFKVEETGLRLDHYGNDGDGWDDEAWQSDIVDPKLQAYSESMMKCFPTDPQIKQQSDGVYWHGNGVVTFHMHDKGNVYMDIALNSIVNVSPIVDQLADDDTAEGRRDSPLPSPKASPLPSRRAINQMSRGYGATNWQNPFFIDW